MCDYTYRDHKGKWSSVDEQSKAGDHDHRENAAHHIVAPSVCEIVGEKESMSHNYNHTQATEVLIY